MRMRKLLALVLSLVVLSVSGSALADGHDSWKITSPANGATVSGTKVTMTVDPGKIKIVNPGPVAPGEGHWHYLLDGKDVGKGAMNSFTFKDLTPGQHVLRVELQKGDHTPFAESGYFQEVTISVTPANTGATIALYAALALALIAGGGFLYFKKGAPKAQ